VAGLVCWGLAGTGRFPERARLLPASPLERAAVRNFVKAVDSGMPALYQVLMNKDASQDEAKIAAAVTMLKELEGLFAKQSAEGPYFLGETFSLADVALVPMLARFSTTLPFYRGADLLALVRARACASVP
jgi:glutathione S-transferase